MPMNDEVREAVERMCEPLHPSVLAGVTAQADARCMEVIRAELTRLTEIADAVDPLVIRLGEVTTRLEAADAMLRDIVSYPWFVSRAPFTADAITDHLSEPRT